MLFSTHGPTLARVFLCSRVGRIPFRGRVSHAMLVLLHLSLSGFASFSFLFVFRCFVRSIIVILSIIVYYNKSK